MGHSARPASPADELARWERRPAPPDNGLLSDDISEFILGGVGISLAARSADGRPLVGYATGVRRDGATLRLVLRRPANEALLAAVEQGSPVAATFSRPIDHRSIQLKAAAGQVLPCEANDFSTMARQASHFRDELVSVGYGVAWASLYTIHDRSEMAVIAFAPEAAFVQTPGPGAGSVLKP